MVPSDAVEKAARCRRSWKQCLASALALISLIAGLSACVEEPPAATPTSTPGPEADLGKPGATVVVPEEPTVAGPSRMASKAVAQAMPRDRLIATATPTASLLMGPAADLLVVKRVPSKRPPIRLQVTPRAGQGVGGIPTRAPLGRPAPTWTAGPRWYPGDPGAGPPGTPSSTPSPPAWREVARWEGKSSKNTETFHISSYEWRIWWDTSPSEDGEGSLAILVYRADGGLLAVAANVIGEDADSTIMRGAGDYYLRIETTQPYVIAVEETQ